MTFHFACRAGDVPRGECREFTCGGRRVLICEYRGDYYAHSPTCTHLDYSLDWAQVRGGSIECPWHHFCYDVATGENVVPGKIAPFGLEEFAKPVAPLGTYPTERRGDEIFVSYDP